jgi:putative NIF3 family GTP cyclohydrolase 1 type 2
MTLSVTRRNQLTTASDIVAYVEKQTGHALSKDEGVHHGDGKSPVKGVTVSWMASPDAIEAAGRNGHQLLIAHESLYYPYDVVILENPPAGWQSWLVNRQRRELLDKYGLTCLRLHGAADELCIGDVFADLLGLGKPVVKQEQGTIRVYEVPECSLDELVRRVKSRLGMPHLRVADKGFGARRVKRIGLPWGGFGLFVNVIVQQKLAALGCDVFITGESDSYGFRFANECGIPMIETSHEDSENHGFRRFSELLAGAFPDVAFQFHDNKNIWRIA